MAEIIPLPRSKGNGAREALIEMEDWRAPRQAGLSWADWVLAELWARGFKVVPLEPSDGD